MCLFGNVRYWGVLTLIAQMSKQKICTLIGSRLYVQEFRRFCVTFTMQKAYNFINELSIVYLLVQNIYSELKAKSVRLTMYLKYKIK